METYYYDGRSYRDIRDALDAVRDDIDSSLGDSDIDAYLREGGPVVCDGEELRTASALRRTDRGLYLSIREELIDMVMSEIREGAEAGEFPIRVPFADTVLECSE
jgi:hypothetical protein